MGASVLAAVALIAWPDVLPALGRWADAACLVRALTGLPCPGCGITTSLLALGRGDLAAAWSANPAGVAVAGLLVGQAVVAAGALRLATAAADVPGRSRMGWFFWLDRLAAAGLLAAWIGRLMGVVP